MFRPPIYVMSARRFKDSVGLNYFIDRISPSDGSAWRLRVQLRAKAAPLEFKLLFEPLISMVGRVRLAAAPKRGDYA
jgi:hypothetical protein